MKKLRLCCLLFIIVSFQSVSLFAKSNTNAYPDYFPKAEMYKNWKPKTAQNLSAPDFLASKRDPDTGNQVWRLGGSAKEMGGKLVHPKGNDRITITHGQHFYSRTNPVNSNETYAIGAAGRGTCRAALWKLSTKQLVAWIPTANPESHYFQRQILWDKKQSNVYWYTEANQLIRVKINLSTYAIEASLVWDKFPEYETISFGLGEGDFSDNGEKIVIVGKHKSGDAENYTIIAYQVNNKQIKATRYIPQVDDQALDWAGVDPTGQLIVFSQPSQGRSTWVLPFDLKGKPRMLYKHMKHSDFVVDNKGQSWIVFGDWQGVFASRLSSPLLKRVWPTLVSVGIPENYDGAENIDDITETASGHISRVADIPSVVLLSRNKDGGLYFVNIDEPEKTIYVGNTRHGSFYSKDLLPITKEEWGVDHNGEVISSDGGQDYLREPRGSASASGKYLFFSSDYHVHDKEYAKKPQLAAYLNMIELR